jgi:hypothetical protein
LNPDYSLKANSPAIGMASDDNDLGAYQTGMQDQLPIGTPESKPDLDLASPILTGQVLASKPVTINLYTSDDELAVSASADTDGTFSLTAPPGTYTIAAAATGFLGAQGPVVTTSGETITKTTVNLLAGDIDGDGGIDQYDAMTIGMNYNVDAPDAADLNADGLVNVLDLEALAANYRATGATFWE